MTVIGGSYMRPMFHTPLGLFLLGLCVVMVLTGSLWIKRIVEIEV
jgi:Flp pilus assembly protein TadB